MLKSTNDKRDGWQTGEIAQVRASDLDQYYYAISTLKLMMISKMVVDR